MIKLLASLFIKNRKDYSKPEVRTAWGLLCARFGIFLNVLLFAGKLTAGLISKSIAMTSDAFNNLSDAASSIVQLIGFKLSSKKPDHDHPFGHGRLEYVSGLVISFLIVLMGFTLFKSSINSILHPEKLEFNLLSLAIMCAAILVKVYMYFYNHLIGKKINSVAMEAVAKDSLSDTISTLFVIAAALASPFTDLPVDGIAGLIVAALVICTGFESAKDTIEPLLGNPPTKEFVAGVEKELLKHHPISGMHDLLVHDYGPDRRMISLHAEVPGDHNIFELHDVIDNAEIAIGKKFNCAVVIHMDPIDVKNRKLAELKAYVNEFLPQIHPELKAHDIRLVPGKTHTNLIFDVVKPYDLDMSEPLLRKKINSHIKAKYNDIWGVITIDSPCVE